MLAFKVEIGRFASKRGITAESALEGIIGNAAAAFADAIRTRVQLRGDLAGQRFPGWNARRRWVAVAPRYPDRAHAGKTGASGARFFRNAQEYHRANQTIPGTYDTTGGMWGGLSVVVQSMRKAELMFRGRSEGRDPNFTRRTSGRGKKRTTRAVAKGGKINNALKAWTVLRQHGVNLLSPSDQEVQAFTEGSLSALAWGLGQAMPIQWDGRIVPLPPSEAFKRRRWG